MKRLHIGCDDADMYISWASLETTEGKGKKAMEILQRAQERGARVQQAPIEAAIAKLNGGEPLPMPGLFLVVLGRRLLLPRGWCYGRLAAAAGQR